MGNGESGSSQNDGPAQVVDVNVYGADSSGETGQDGNKQPRDEDGKQRETNESAPEVLKKHIEDVIRAGDPVIQGYSFFTEFLFDFIR
jgi:hypothetical protein